jgi:hypothetical protein
VTNAVESRLSAIAIRDGADRLCDPIRARLGMKKELPIAETPRYGHLGALAGLDPNHPLVKVTEAEHDRLMQRLERQASNPRCGWSR